MRNMKWNRQNLHDSCLMFRGTEQWSEVPCQHDSALCQGTPPPSHCFPAVMVSFSYAHISFRNGHFHIHTLMDIYCRHIFYPSSSLFTGDVSVQGLSYWLLWGLSLSTQEKLLSSGLSAFTHLSSFLVMSHKGDLQSTFSLSPIFT